MAVNVQEDETPGGIPPRDPDRDRDVLAERRARRGEPVGDPILIRRAETAEAAAHALEDRLSGIQARLREAEQEARAASERLVERERELGLASRRLGEGEQQLRSISERLADRERELHAVSERLGDRERELRAVSDRLAEREQQLQRAELEIRGRVDALELRVGEVQEELARERAARQRAEGQLEALRVAQATIQPLVSELKQTAHRLRLAAEASQPAPAAAPVETSPAAPPSAAAETSGPPPRAAEPSGSQMAEALAAAVQRLRARVAAVAADDEQSGEQRTAQGDQAGAEEKTQEAVPAEPAERGEPYAPPLADGPAQPRAWLAPAIRRVAQRRDARLAGELVLELLPAQALSLQGELRYGARIAELGRYEISLSGGRGSVREVSANEPIDSSLPVLEGSAEAFAELAAGGSRLSAWRPPAGLRIRKGRRRVKPLLASRRTPLALAELEQAGITVWPGLLLLALAEAIDPALTASHSFAIAFAIEGQQSAVLNVQAAAGAPLAVTRAQEAPPGREAPPQASPQTAVHLSERAFARMLTGRETAGEKITVEGDLAPLRTLLAWTDKVQGIRRLAA